MSKPQKTNKATFTIGTVPGYFHGNGGSSLEEFNNLYKEMAAQVMHENGIYISAVSVPSRCLYHRDWGCPRGGEETFTVSATRNPQFTTDEEAWKEAFLKVVTYLKEELKQSTVSVEFSEVDFVYLAD